MTFALVAVWLFVDNRVFFAVSSVQLLLPLLDKCGVTIDPVVMKHSYFTQDMARYIAGYFLVGGEGGESFPLQIGSNNIFSTI